MKRTFDSNYKAKTFMVWLFLFSSFMFFSALVSAFIVQLASSDSVALDSSEYPSGFLFSTVIILLSSLTMHKAYVAGYKTDVKIQNQYLRYTIFLGIIFFISQFIAWRQLIEGGIFFVSTNAGETFVYVFTSFHLAHVVAGIILLIWSLWSKKRNISSAENRLRLHTTSIFWHFIDVIWVYLYLFLLLY